jgi:hypothetical protein
MPKPTPWEDEYTLLCERCGYVLEGLDQSSVCPECGKPIAESLPERRIGTPWQQKPGFKSLVRTWWMTLRHPKKILDMATPTHPQRLPLLTILAASLIASMGWILPLFLPTKNADDFPDTSILIWIIIIFAFALIPFFLFFILTFVETKGLRFLGNRKDYRITPGISKAITGHGSVGWLLCAFGLVFAQLLGYALVYTMTPNQTVLTFENGNRIFQLGPPQWVYTANFALYALILPGFLFFEFFAYLGLRRCKYANRLRPQEQSDG